MNAKKEPPPLQNAYLLLPYLWFPLSVATATAQRTAMPACGMWAEAAVL